MPSITHFNHLICGFMAQPHFRFLPTALQGCSVSCLRLMGTGEVSPGFKATSKPYWESGQSSSDLLPVFLPSFPPQEDEAGGW